MVKQNRFSAMRDALKGTPEQEVSTPTPPSEPVSPAPAKQRTRPLGKRSDPNYEQVGAYIPKALNKQVKRLLLDREGDFSDLVTQLLEEWIKRSST